MSARQSRKLKLAATEGKTAANRQPTPRDLYQIDRKIEEAAYVFLDIHDLANLLTDRIEDKPELAGIRALAARGIQMLDATMGRLAGNDAPTLGNFRPADELSHFNGADMSDLDKQQPDAVQP